MSAIQQILSSLKWSTWLLTGLVAYWKFDESSWNASDSSWGGFTLTNTLSATYSAGMLNNAVTTGTGYMNTTSDLWLNGSSQNFTFAYWIKPTSTIAVQQVFFNHTDAWQHNDIQMDWASSNARLVRTRLGVASDIAQVAQTFTWGVAYCLVGKYDGTTLSMRINNGTATTIASSGNWTSAWTDGFFVWITSGLTASYVWQVDEFAVANRAWTATEETTFYNGGTPLPLSSY